MSRWSQFHELTGAAFYYKSEINVSPGQVLTGLELSLLKTLPPSAPGPSTCLMHPTWAGDLFHPR